MPNDVLGIEGLWAGYGGGDTLRGVDLEIKESEVVAVVGRNGVGKTTLMRCIIGLLAPARGRILFRDRDITRLAPHRRAIRGMGYVPQGREIFPELTVEENLRMGEQVNQENRHPRLDLVYDYFPILKERSRQLGGTLSGGQQQMLAIGRALIGGPFLLLLDEPSVGIQPSIIQEIGRALVKLNSEEGLTILLVEQNLELISRVAHRAYAFDKGQVVTTFSGEQLKDRELLVRYLAVTS